MTIRRGKVELDSDPLEQLSDRVRAPGGGRKKAEVTDPELLNELENLTEPETRGDPESPLRWTTKSARKLAEQLTETGHSISPPPSPNSSAPWATVFKELARRWGGSQYPDRDNQFRYINKLAREFLAAGTL